MASSEADCEVPNTPQDEPEPVESSHPEPACQEAQKWIEVSASLGYIPAIILPCTWDNCMDMGFFSSESELGILIQHYCTVTCWGTLQSRSLVSDCWASGQCGTWFLSLACWNAWATVKLFSHTCLCAYFKFSHTALVHFTNAHGPFA